MALQTSGPISFADINEEIQNTPTTELDIAYAAGLWGLSAPHSISEFYGLSDPTGGYGTSS